MYSKKPEPKMPWWQLVLGWTGLGIVGIFYLALFLVMAMAVLSVFADAVGIW